MAETQRSRHDVEATASLAFSFDRPRPATVPRTKADLHICRCCHSDLVYPLDWAPLNGKRWTVDLRCPDCEWRGSGVFGQRVVDRFDKALNAGTSRLLNDLQLLTRANTEEQIDVFVAALHAGDILPEDF